MSRTGAKPLLVIAVLAAAVLLAILSVRDRVGLAPRSHPLKPLASLWPGHPHVAIERLLVEAALAAKANGSLGADQRERLKRVGQVAPLRPQPFMLEGAVAQLSGDTGRALSLYRAARIRDPREPATRLLLADLELRSGQIESGLFNLVSITRIEPNKAGAVVPALAKYAEAPGAVAEMRRLFQRNQALAGSVLYELAANPANGLLIRRLASRGADQTDAPWKHRLVESTLATGDVRASRQLWAEFNRVTESSDELPFNPNFRSLAASAPFNWTLSSGSGGLAELRPGGGLSIVHFGREPVMLARQLITPSPGRYAIITRLDQPAEPGRMEWRLRCITSQQMQSVPVDGQRRVLEASASCPGHWLELHAVPDETEQQIERTLRRVELRKVG